MPPRKRAASKPVPEKNVTPEPMDPSVREAVTPVTASNNARNAYALNTLIEEVTALFPETTYEVSGYNAFNTALDVKFDGLTDPHAHELLDMAYATDRSRVAEVIHEDDSVLVRLHSNFVTQDDRSSFNLAVAHNILTSGETGFGMGGFGE